MPNIGLHGMDLERAQETTDSICKVLKDLRLLDESVIEVFPTQVVFGHTREPAPYIRIADTNLLRAKAIREALRINRININTETLELASFTPA